MPTVLQIFGWRLHFFANEGNEPIHIHCTKGDMEHKFWLHRENFDISEAYGDNFDAERKKNGSQDYSGKFPVFRGTVGRIPKKEMQ